MRKLNKPTDQRLAVLKNQATNLLWYGKLNTTVAKAKEVQKYVEKLLSKAISSFEDTVKIVKTSTNDKGVKSSKEIINDGAKKLVARRALMSSLNDIQEQRETKESKTAFVKRTQDIAHPLIEKIFNEYAPKYAHRTKELGVGGGYTRIVKLGTRNGDCAEMALIELI